MAAIGASGQAAGVGNASAVAMLPDRTLRCTLGRATNLDPHKDQTIDEIVFEGRHEFVLFLPSIPVRQGPPPDPIDPAEPVDSRTRIVSDPSGLTKTFPKRFDRVVDYWPDGVEMTTIIQDPLLNLITVNPIDSERGTARLYMAQATDVAPLDLTNVYQADCEVSIEQVSPAKG